MATSTAIRRCAKDTRERPIVRPMSLPASFCDHFVTPFLILLKRLQLKLEANRLGYKNTAHIAAIDDALALQPVDLIKRQLQRAIQSGDVFRSCVKESELKDLALDRFPPEALSLSACALLKTPATYAEGVWLGSRAEEARVTMRRWQHGPLVQSLTPLSAVNATKAKAAFRDIQTCMGDHKIRKGDSEVDVLQRLIADASAVPELRPEGE